MSNPHTKQYRNRLGVTQWMPSTKLVERLIAKNEGFCLALAQAMKLPSAEARIHQAGDRRFLLVARYDRQRDAHAQRHARARTY